MNEELLKFQSNKYSFVKCVAEKKQSNGDWLQLEIRVDGTNIILFDKWVNLKESSNSKPRKRGGKRGYIKVYQEELNRLVDDGISGETIGFAMLFAKCIEWETGLIRNMSKRGKPICTQEDIAKITNVPYATTRRRIKELSSYGILEKTPEGYVVNSYIIGKGGR